MKRVLFLFLDGVGLGQSDPAVNPLVRADMPALRSLLGENPLVESSAPYDGSRATLLSLDACLGVDGLPQSATGQAVLLSGVNVPAVLGRHYGPKPDPSIAQILSNGNLFNILRSKGLKTALLNAYPPRYFEAIASGRRIYSAIPLAVTRAGIQLKTEQELKAGLALAADFTAQGWHDHLGLTDAPLLDPYLAGEKLAQLARQYDFSLFEYWLTDYAGHRQDMQQAVSLLEQFDQVLTGLVEAWDQRNDLILITSDHGNLEDISTRRHTSNPVPGLLIGPQELREQFSKDLSSIAGITPAILKVLG